MSADQQAPVLLAVLEYGELPELLRVAQVASATLQKQAVFFFVKSSYRRLVEDTKAVIAHGFAWMDAAGHLHHISAADLSPVEQTPVAAGHARDSLPGRELDGEKSRAWPAPTNTLRLLARDVANFGRDIRRFKHRYRQLKAILTQCQPALLIVGQDTPGTDLSFLLIAAGRLRIARLMTPFAMFSIQETAEYAAARPEHGTSSGLLNRLVATFFPRWVLQYERAALLRLPGYRALALEIAGLVQGLPWSPLSTPVEAITADSQVAANALVALGLKQGVINVVGSPAQDRLAHHLAHRSELREGVCLEHGLDPSKPLLVCGWPVNMFVWLAGRPIAYPDYAAVSSAWAHILVEVRKQHGVNVVISVHPKTLVQEYTVAQRMGLPCRLSGADELIAACDVFTTLNGSSITALAIACGVPALIYDCFLTRYPEFLEVPGCVNVDTEEAFRAELNVLCADPERRKTLAQRQQSVAGQWGKLDGQAGVRLGGLISKLVAGSPR